MVISKNCLFEGINNVCKSNRLFQTWTEVFLKHFEAEKSNFSEMKLREIYRRFDMYREASVINKMNIDLLLQDGDKKTGKTHWLSDKQ